MSKALSVLQAIELLHRAVDNRQPGVDNVGKNDKQVSLMGGFLCSGHFGVCGGYMGLEVALGGSCIHRAIRRRSDSHS